MFRWTMNFDLLRISNGTDRLHVSFQTRFDRAFLYLCTRLGCGYGVVAVEVYDTFELI